MRGHGVRCCLALVMLAATAGVGPAGARDKSAAKAPPVRTPSITKDAVNAARFPEGEPATTGTLPKGTMHEGKMHEGENGADRAKAPDPLLMKVQVLLDRAHFSPGAIDGRDGDNMKGALAAYAAAQGLPATGKLDRALFDRLQAGSGEPAAVDYTLTEDDVSGPYAKIPPTMEAQAKLKAMGYTNVREMLAERFHMQRDLLSALNPGRPLDKAGTVITVAGVAPLGDGKVADAPLAPKVARIEVDKTARRVKAFGADGRLVADYPASIGSEEKPAPTGVFKATRAAFDPWYRYDPKYRFKGVKTRHAFKIAPGPNSPVGLVWIDLSIPSYGIHGTPEPEKVGKTESHGCIRLTNWDARDLASHVERNARVEFVER